MDEGSNALGKIRGYTYILFFMYVTMFFHKQIADLFGTEDRRILYGFIMLTAFQVTFCILYIIKFGTTVGNGKKRGAIMGYAASVRATLIGQYAFLIIALLNDLFEGSFYIDKAAILMCIIMIYYELKFLTILQRRQY